MLDLIPQKEEQVEVIGYKGRFVVREHWIGADGHDLFRLDSLYPGLTLDEIRYPMMTYPPEEKVKKVLPQILPQCGPWPEDFEVYKYDVKSGEMYDGTPRVTVYFHLKPGVIPSVEKAHVWNNFYARLDKAFQFIDIDSGKQPATWLKFAAKEDRSALRAAS